MFLLPHSANWPGRILPFTTVFVIFNLFLLLGTAHGDSLQTCLKAAEGDINSCNRLLELQNIARTNMQDYLEANMTGGAAHCTPNKLNIRREWYVRYLPVATWKHRLARNPVKS